MCKREGGILSAFCTLRSWALLQAWRRPHSRIPNNSRLPVTARRLSTAHLGGCHRVRPIYFSKAGGDLLDFIASKETYNEREARGVVRSLLGAVKYLHGKGITHGNLTVKCELCGTWYRVHHGVISSKGFVS